MLDDYVDRNALEVIDMKAVYFDTDDLDLRKAGIAYRVRYENDRITATVKWDNKVEDGLHSREEFNLVSTMKGSLWSLTLKPSSQAKHMMCLSRQQEARS